MAANRSNIGWYIENQITDIDGKAAGKIYEREVILSSADIKALASSKELVPAPGADRVLEFISAVIKVTAGEAYVEPTAPDDLVIEYSGGQDVSGTIEATELLVQITDEVRVIPLNLTAMDIETDLEGLKNTSLQLTNTGDDYTTGTGTMIVKTTYRIHDFN